MSNPFSRGRSADSARFVAMAMAALMTIGCGSNAGDAQNSIGVATRGPFVAVVETAGSLEAVSKAALHAPFPATIEWLAPEGSRISKGATVFRLDAEENRRVLSEKELERDTAVFDRKLKDLDLTEEEFALINRLSFGKGDLSILEITREQIERGVDPAELVRLEKASQNSANALGNLVGSREEKAPWAGKGFVSADEMASLIASIAKEELAGRVLAIESRLVERGGKPAEIAAAVKDVLLSKSALGLVAARLDGFTARRKENEMELATKLAGTEAEIAYRGSLVAQSIVTAPIDGIIVYATMSRNSPRESSMRAGSRVELGAQVAWVVQPGHMKIGATLSHRDALRVRPGQRVTFRPSAYPDREFGGKVKRVGAAMTGNQLERWVYPAILTTKAEIEAEREDPVLRPGMTCRVRVELAPPREAVSIETSALVSGAVVLEDGRMRKVKVGESGPDRTEILEGLSAGERVRLPARPAATGLTGPSKIAVTRVGTLEVRVKAAGQVEAISETDVTIRDLDNQPKIVWLGKDGSAVKKGEVIAKLEEEPLKDRLAEKTLELETTRKEKSVSEANGRASAQRFETELALAEQDLVVAKLEKELVDGGKRPRELSDLETDLALAAKDLAAAQSRLDLTSELARRGHASRAEVKELTAKRDVAAGAHAVAVEKRRLGVAGATRSERRKAALRVEKAQLSFELARRKHTNEEERARLIKEKLSRRESHLLRAVGRQSGIVASATVTAPVDGTLVLLEHWSSEGIVKAAVGDTVNAGVPFLQIANMSQFRIVAHVPEEKVPGIRTGQPAEFWPLAAPGQRYPGRVETLAPLATEKRRMFGLFAGEQGFDVAVTALGESRKFQPGMSVECEVLTTSLSGVVLAPAAALLAGISGASVVMAGGEVRPVRVRAVGETDFAVDGGLSAGESILVPSDETGGGP